MDKIWLLGNQECTNIKGKLNGPGWHVYGMGVMSEQTQLTAMMQTQTETVD
jgi:hypothetical protein